MTWGDAAVDLRNRGPPSVGASVGLPEQMTWCDATAGHRQHRRQLSGGVSAGPLPRGRGGTTCAEFLGAEEVAAVQALL